MALGTRSFSLFINNAIILKRHEKVNIPWISQYKGCFGILFYCFPAKQSEGVVCYPQTFQSFDSICKPDNVAEKIIISVLAWRGRGQGME